MYHKMLNNHNIMDLCIIRNHLTAVKCFSIINKTVKIRINH